MLSKRAMLSARRLHVSLLRLLPQSEAGSTLHAGLCTAVDLLLRADGPAQPEAAHRLHSTLVEPLSPSPAPHLHAVRAAADGPSLGAGDSVADHRLLSARHANGAGVATLDDSPGTPDQAGGAFQQNRARPPGRGPRRRAPSASREQSQLRWEPDQEDLQGVGGGHRWQQGPPSGPRNPRRPRQRPLLSEDNGPGFLQAQGTGWGQQQLAPADRKGLGDQRRDSEQGDGPSAREGKQAAGVAAWQQGPVPRFLPPPLHRAGESPQQPGPVRPQRPPRPPPPKPASMLSGNPQQIILERAEWAVAEGTPQALQAYVDDLRLLLEQRRDDMHMVQVSSCIHRLGRIANTVSSKRNPLAHVDTLVDSTPGLRELLTELSEMAVGMAGEMDSRAVPNVLWAMGMLRQNLLEGRLLNAVCERIMELSREEGGKFLNSMGCAHAFWSFASLRVNPLDGAVLDAIGEHLMKPAAAGGFTGIDLSNMFWACGILGINPCEGRLLPALAKHVTLKTDNMNQQGCSNIMWGLAKQDLKQQEMYGMKGRPYLPMIEALVARSMEVMQNDAAPVNFSMITWALGSMSYHPGETYMKHMIEHLQTSQLIQKFDAQNLCNMIWGMARLAEHPGEALMAVYRQRQDRILYDPRRSKADTEQALTNVLWAMAVLDELDADMATEVYGLIDPADSNTYARVQLFQAHLYLFSALPMGSAPPMPAALFKSCKDAWNQVKTQVRVSSLHWSILNAVRNAGFRVYPEYNDGVFSIDMAVFLPHPDGDPIKVAIEADGVEHYTCNRPVVDGVQQHRPTGRTLLRNKLLRARGWLVVDVPYFEWNALRSSKARTDYLKAAIALEVQSKCSFMRGLTAAAAAA